MKLQNYETSLIGRWIAAGGQVHADDTCERIHWLTTNHLRQIGVSRQWGAWETLFQDPDDGRYWERTYPQGEMPGGGPPALTMMTKDQAREKYGDVVE